MGRPLIRFEIVLSRIRDSVIQPKQTLVNTTVDITHRSKSHLSRAQVTKRSLMTHDDSVLQEPALRGVLRLS